MGDFDFGSIVSVLPFLLKGLTYTIQLTVVAAIGGTLLGILLALARLSHLKWLSLLAASYINLMRSIPLLLVIFWFYFLVPVMLQSITGSDYPPKIGAERSAYFTFILFEAAYFAEIVRAGIQSIPKGQLGAAYALGLTYAQSMRLIILPQALRNMLPVLLTQTIVLFQDVSLVALLNVTDFVGAAMKIAQRDSRVVEMYTLVAVVYFVLSFLLSQGVKRLHQRIAIVR
ncbi:amino acid ABC transporter permease [Thiomonas arsenitoxydans]|jgi:glutamate/aspartate transport system permease protein|uniref:amino acid ABC transporter permease n=1 Tax=Thiomonas arsenitoxydans (strain DSM 22701 / CIP 110005 / 3As) TaxID=426114 RepID=UPI001AD2EB04|nr:amino acid ABC transporter permease [Thiomonas arsenitoxydans]MBN8775320.1 amino acid ABC transporter permease [Thiomonas arsenitoxydans]